MHPVVDNLALKLARIQFATNISFHILFPTITVGMSWILLYLKIFWQDKYPRLDRTYHFWIKIFALTFALGTVSGVTMSFQFGTNWPGFMHTVGNIAGPLLAYEVLTAFFLEASFLGIMLFAYDLVPRWVHTLAIAAVALGTTLSTFWIVSLNAWMHTPAGFHMEGGKAIVDNWFDVIFNPSQPYRLTHTLLSSLLTASFFMAGISAWRLLKYPKDTMAYDILKLTLHIAAWVIPIQIIVGDLHGLNSLKYHPETVAAMEALWDTGTQAPLVLIADIDPIKRKNNYALEIPYGSSLILTHDINGTVQGLNAFAEHPPVRPVFWGFRIMVGTAVLMALTAWFGSIHMRGHRQPHKWFLYFTALMTFSGWVATLAGWYVTEIGRQPYLVSGVLKTADAIGPVRSDVIYSSLIMYGLLYTFLLCAYIGTLAYLSRKDTL